jgi:hypothetical protein
MHLGTQEEAILCKSVNYDLYHMYSYYHVLHHAGARRLAGSVPLQMLEHGHPTIIAPCLQLL